VPGASGVEERCSVGQNCRAQGESHLTIDRVGRVDDSKCGSRLRSEAVEGLGSQAASAGLRYGCKVHGRTFRMPMMPTTKAEERCAYNATGSSR
jgi:hypothetical protein